ncbi:hypothetical protein TNCV_309061 [Trichonephila clavipes]|nr:hypothetical protein TNCV_309061 [Trichonephila clavipes]
MGIHKGLRSDQQRTSTSEESSVGVLDSFPQSPQKSTSQYALNINFDSPGIGNGLSGTGGLNVSESFSLAEDCDRSGNIS